MDQRSYRGRNFHKFFNLINMNCYFHEWEVRWFILLLILLYGKLREQAVCGKFCVLIGYPSRQDERYFPLGTARFVPANKILPKCKQVHETFLSLKLLSAKVKRFFVLSVSLWNQKTGKPKASMRMKKKKTKLLICLKNMFCKKQVRRSFIFSALYAI